MIVDRVTDIEFLEREIGHREHFLYVYGKHSGLLRSAVKAHCQAFAERVGWKSTNVTAGGTLCGQLNAPSLFGETFIMCDAADFDRDDLASTLEDVAEARCSNHLLLTVPDGSDLLEQKGWLRAKDVVGIIEEPRVTMSNYRSVTRSLLGRSDLAHVKQFGEDERFLSRIKSFVQVAKWRSPRAVAMEIESIILTEMQNGALVRELRSEERRERLVLSEDLNRFLDDCCQGTLHSLMKLMHQALQSGAGVTELLVRLFRASARIVAGSDQRYKRNREGNPAVLPYLAWGILLLESEKQFAAGNFLVALERLCQTYHEAAVRSETWVADEANWRSIGRWLLMEPRSGARTLDQARADLWSALSQRAASLPETLGSGGMSFPRSIPLGEPNKQSKDLEASHEQ